MRLFSISTVCVFGMVGALCAQPALAANDKAKPVLATNATDWVVVDAAGKLVGPLIPSGHGDSNAVLANVGGKTVAINVDYQRNAQTAENSNKLSWHIPETTLAFSANNCKGQAILQTTDALPRLNVAVEQGVVHRNEEGLFYYPVDSDKTRNSAIKSFSTPDGCTTIDKAGAGEFFVLGKPVNIGALYREPLTVQRR